jgi:hypothetical protein
MSVCPRCGHQNDAGVVVCTRCGLDLRPDRPGEPGKSFYPRVALWLSLGVLMTILVFLVMIYLENVNKFAR